MQRNSALRLINAAAAHSAPTTPAQDAARKRAARVPSHAEQITQQRLALLSQTYTHVLDDAQRLQYKDLARNYPVGKTGSTRPRDCFIALNSARIQAGMEILLDIGPLPQMNQSLPDYTLTAVNGASGFHLVITPEADFAGMLLLSATRPLSPGIMEISRSAYVFVRKADALSGEWDAADAYRAAVGRSAAAGTRVGVCLTPLSALGFPGRPLFHDVIVSG